MPRKFREGRKTWERLCSKALRGVKVGMVHWYVRKLIEKERGGGLFGKGKEKREKKAVFNQVDGSH